MRGDMEGRGVEKLFSTTELARLWNVSESTVKRWADAGDLVCVKTPGGHRRFTFDEVSRFQRAQGFEAVGRLIRTGEDEADTAVPEIERALERPDFKALSDLCFRSAVEGATVGVATVFARAYLRGVAPIDLYDRILTPAMHHIGDAWVRGELTVADEHLATRTVLDAVVRLQPDLKRRAQNGRVVVVGCPEDEMHEVAARCAAFLFEIEGWRAIALGMNTPFFSFVSAVERHKPTLVCVSSSMMMDLERRAFEYTALAEAVRAAGSRLAIGGAGFADPAVRARFPHDYHASGFRDLLRYAASI